MKTLFLLRHTKSSSKDQKLPDFERPLNRRGRRDAEAVGRFLKMKEIVPDLVLSSPALRARETVEHVTRAAKWRTEVRYDERIYEAGAVRLLEVISQIESERKTVFVVGHNPGMEEVLHLLTGRMEQVPTGGLAKVLLKTPKWAAIVDKKANLEWLVKPKEMRVV
jgi:phosphohistidine phosphatase